MEMTGADGSSMVMGRIALSTTSRITSRITSRSTAYQAPDSRMLAAILQELREIKEMLQLLNDARAIAVAQED